MENRFETFVGLSSSINKEIQRIKTVEMGRFGLKGTDVMCLYNLERRPEGLTESELARLIGQNRAATSRTVAHLVSEGLVSRGRGTSGGYRAPILLTDEGSSLMAEANEVIRRVVSHAGVGLTVADLDVMYRTLRSILSNLEGLSRDGTDRRDDDTSKERN